MNQLKALSRAMNHHRQTKDLQTHLFVVLYLKQQFRVVLALAVATNEDVLAAIDTSRKDFLKSVQPCLFCTRWHHRQRRPRSCTTNRLKSWNHGLQIQDISSGARKKTHSARVEVRLRTNTEES